MDTTQVLLQVAVSEDWLDAFAGQIRDAGRSERTVLAYCQAVRSFAAWFEGENGEVFSPELITSTDLRGWRAFAVANKVKPATWNLRRAALAVFCEWGRGQGYLSYDPLQGVDALAQEELPARWLEKSEEHRLMRQVELQVNGAATPAWRAQALRDAAMVGLMLYAGLRVAEVAALDCSDMLLTERTGRVIVRQGKGMKRREVPLNAEARLALREWLKASGRQAGALFVGKGSGRITTKGIQDRVDALRQAAGLEGDVTPHALRHTFAKRLADSGVQLTVIQKLLGHARLETTGRYVQPGWSDFEKAVEKR